MKGKNRTYTLGDVTLLRNVESIRPELDGWWIDCVPALGLSVRIPPEWALAMIRQWRRNAGRGYGLREIADTGRVEFVSKQISAADMAATRQKAYDDLEARLEHENRAVLLGSWRVIRRQETLANADPNADPLTVRRARQQVARMYGEIVSILAELS